MLPAEALRDADAPPLLFRQQAQGGALCVPVVVGYYLHLEELFREDDMAVFILVVGVLVRVVDAGCGMKVTFTETGRRVHMERASRIYDFFDFLGVFLLRLVGGELWLAGGHAVG